MSLVGQTEKNPVRAKVFRFALELRHRAMLSARRICANKRLMHRSKLHRYSITSSERASDRCLRWTVNKALIKSLTQE